jgi:predicted peptidase
MSLNRTSRFILLLLMINTSSGYTPARTRDTGFLNRTITIGANTYRYQVYVPADKNPKKKRPIIVYLHGTEAFGVDGLLQTQGGLGDAIRKQAERFSCIVVFPQCREKTRWVNDEMEEQVLKALTRTVKEFNGDPQQLYLTGISMGGVGTWYIAAQHPGVFAAIVPIAGRIVLPKLSTFAPLPPKVATITDSQNPYQSIAYLLGKIPVWVFHGGEDPVNSVTESRKMVEALKAAGGNVKYTEYEGVGHVCWDKAYAEPELLPWLFSQPLSK